MNNINGQGEVDMSVDPIIRDALRKLFDPMKHFNICTFDVICKLLNVIPPPGHYDRLRLLHCRDYRDMSEEVRRELGRLVYESLNSPGFDIEIRRVASLGVGKVRAIIGPPSDEAPAATIEAHEDGFRKVRSLPNYWHSFRSGYQFYMRSWYSIWMREGIQPWMRGCNIWGKGRVQ